MCPGLFVRTCIWNVSRGTVYRSWQTRTALLAWSAPSFCFKSSCSMPLTSFLRTKDVFSVTSPDNRQNEVSGSQSVNLFAVYPFKYKLFIKILSSSLNTMLIVNKHCSDVCCGEFPVPQIDRKSKQVKEQCLENFICNRYVERCAILNTENIKIFGWITKLEAIKN